MSFAKESQDLSLDGTDILMVPIMDKNELRMPLDYSIPMADMIVSEEDEEPAAIHVEHESAPALILTLDHVPGGLDQEEMVEEPESIEVEEPEEIEVNNDPWDWGGKASNFLPWLSKMMQGIPAHSGRDTAGLERAIAYLETLDREISRAVRTDLNNEIAIESVEKARDEIQRGLERLEDRLDKVKSSKYPKKNKKKTKRGEEENEILVKEAQKSPGVGGIVVSVPLLISGLARVCINGTISAGHDIEDMLLKVSKKFDLTSREQFELVQLITDMNYPVRRDRGFLLDEEIDTKSSDNFDWAANYSA